MFGKLKYARKIPFDQEHHTLSHNIISMMSGVKISNRYGNVNRRVHVYSGYLGCARGRNFREQIIWAVFRAKDYLPKLTVVYFLRVRRGTSPHQTRETNAGGGGVTLRRNTRRVKPTPEEEG